MTHRPGIHQLLRGASPEIRNLLIAAHHQGFGVTRTRSGHYAVTTPEHIRPKRTTFTPQHPGDARSVKQALSQLRGIGVDISRPRQRKKDAS